MKFLKRREFLKTTVAGSLGASMLMPEMLPAKDISEKTSSEPLPGTQAAKKVIVAGAGIAGLCCGYELMKRGHEVLAPGS